MKSKKRTQIAVLRHTLGSYEGQEEVFAATVQCSVSWVKKASSGLRTITPKTARQVSLAVAEHFKVHHQCSNQSAPLEGCFWLRDLIHFCKCS